jgi:hypothetical protein
MVILFSMLAGCRTAPVLNVTDAPVVVGSKKAVTAEQVKLAIVRAGTRLGWQMSDTQPGLIKAQIALRTHTASADVRYTPTTYSIIYRDSTNLSASDGQIHTNYNGWIQNLDREIRLELLSL